MKQQVGPGVVAVVVVIAVILIGWWAWKNFAPPTANSGSNPYETKGVRGSGGPPVGMGPTAPMGPGIRMSGSGGGPASGPGR